MLTRLCHVSAAGYSRYVGRVFLSAPATNGSQIAVMAHVRYPGRLCSPRVSDCVIGSTRFDAADRRVVLRQSLGIDGISPRPNFVHTCRQLLPQRRLFRGFIRQRRQLKDHPFENAVMPVHLYLCHDASILSSYPWRGDAIDRRPYASTFRRLVVRRVVENTCCRRRRAGSALGRPPMLRARQRM